MANDQQTYGRAATAAMIGAAVQLIIAVGVALVGLFTYSPAVHAVTWHLFGGLPIWLILWVLFHQHRLERREALEAEQLARNDARTAALFEDAGENLQVARRRLELLYKWWLPIVSVVVAVYLLGVGITLATLAWREWLEGTLRVSPFSGRVLEGNSAIIVAIVLGVTAFVGFLIGRYIAGMTKVREWTLLRGGAAYLMGSVLLVALLAIGWMLIAAGVVPALMGMAAIVVPIMTALLGLEMLLGFVFGLYRPRRPGEADRPAFDSRLLGLLTRPESIGKTIGEAINYQFGFEISRSWFYRMLARALTPLVLTGAAVLIGLTSIVIIEPEQQGLITLNGRVVGVVDPGIHFKWPWPIGRVTKHDAYRVQQIVIGSEGGGTRPDVAILWTNQHTQNKEDYLVTAAARFAGQAQGDGPQGAPVELIGARVVVKYRVSDLHAFLTAAAEPEAVLRNVAARRLTMYFATHTVDQLLAQGRTDAGEQLRELIAADLATFPQPLGIEVVFAGFESIHPPQDGEVAAKFNEQIGARQQKAAAIQDAEKLAISRLAEVAGSREKAMRISAAIEDLDNASKATRSGAAGGVDAEQMAALEEELQKRELAIEQLLDDAGGRAAEMILKARAYRWQHSVVERGRALRVAQQVLAFHNAPDYYRKRLFLETVTEALKDRRKMVLAADSGTNSEVRLELQDQGADLTTFMPTNND